jgi:hypothetical protein
MDSLSDYYDFIQKLDINRTFTIKTNKNLYKLTTLPEYKITISNETETQFITEEVFNETINQTVNVTREVEVPKVIKEVIGMQDIGLNLYEAPKTNIKMGLDLVGGSRVVLKPQEKISQQDMDFTIGNIKERLNVFGLSDLIVRQASDLESNDFIIVEIAGATKEEVRSLLASQ